ncbi:hypothetical protein G7046_g567 [Stylonectria norvegica]|nr:hypothetical protein G7046_g567 [Stylonectria norvegica]
MSTVELNYFTCTLGEAIRWKRSLDVPGVEPFATVIDLIDRQAQLQPNSPALGFANFLSEESSTSLPDSLTFGELRDLSIIAGKTLHSRLKPSSIAGEKATVALLCPSSHRFMLTWLGLLRLGYSVLLLAPQLEPEAIRHLCASLEIDTILVEAKLKHRVSGLAKSTTVVDVPSYEQLTRLALPESPLQSIKMRELSEIAYFCHTSGTSSGLPKPIQQTHQGLVSVLASFPGENKPATFSTTPLYHGGLVDCFRAWASGAMIWFFPEGVAPITEANLTRTINFARSKSSVVVKYFSSVPYVLKMLAEEEAGIRILQTMDLVGVGGAALAPAIGDKLVRNGVKLLSRMGSAECGFLMSSSRDFENDKEWQYLRPIDDPLLLVFETRNDGLSELVVQPDWPFRAKTNREDGSYATSDLFQPHPFLENAWRYHSRSDAQITLANGKKFDPAPLEASILASSKLLRDVLIFGSDRDYAGALLFPATVDIPAEHVIESVWPHIRDMNSKSQNHARITRPMVVVVPLDEGKQPLEKSSKGTINRPKADEQYRDIIESAYDGREASLPDKELATMEQLSAQVADCFYQVLGLRLDADKDLYHQGLDSLSCIQVRRLLESTYLQRPLPMNVIYDHGTINGLVAYLHNLEHGTTPGIYQGKASQMELAEDLINKYSGFRNAALAPSSPAVESIVLTGATGFLGAHILHLLRQNDMITKVYCLTRASSFSAAHDRVSEALAIRGMPRLDPFDDRVKSTSSKVICLPCDLSKEDLGLSAFYRDQVRGKGTVFIHSAWTVNFNLRLGSFEDQIAATRNLLDFSAGGGARFIFLSSIASVSSSHSAVIPETLSKDLAEASPLGYSQSKWVAEQICLAASDHFIDTGSSDVQISPAISIIRVGQLCGNSIGAWNTSEAYPLMLSTSSITGCLPNLQHEALNWMPAEIAAQAVLEIVLPTRPSSHTKLGNGSRETSLQQGLPVYHVLNPNRTPTWEQMLLWILEDTEEPRFEIVEPKEWVSRLEKALQERSAGHPSQALIGLWKDGITNTDDSGTHPIFDVSLAKGASETMRNLKPVDRARIQKIWRWVQRNI